MADPTGLTTDIGAWLTVLLGLIALIGIIGPLLLLRQARSERSQALTLIDSRGGYITKGLYFGKGIHLFRKFRVPQLQTPPDSSVSFTLSDSTTGPSSTGWVNLAALMEPYPPNVKRGYNIFIHNKGAWLPCNRFWILGFGLRGRYAHRRDQGKAIVEENASRLMIENEADDEDGGFGVVPSTERLYGITGTLWWKRSLTASESPLDQVFFSAYWGPTRQSLDRDNVTTSTLFWLSIGCLPLNTRGGVRVYDLSHFKASYNSQLPGPPKRTPARRSSPPLRRLPRSRLQPETQHDNLTEGSDDLEQMNPPFVIRRHYIPHADFYEFKKRNLAQDGSNTEWACAMGADMRNVWSLVHVDSPPEDLNRVFNKTASERGPWYELGSPRRREFILKSDVHCLALALANLPISPKGFLFDLDRSFYNFVGRGALYLSPRLLQWALKKETKCPGAIGMKPEDVAVLREISGWDLFWESTREDENRFSRKCAQICFEMDAILKGRASTISPFVQNVIAILTICSASFQRGLEEVAGESVPDESASSESSSNESSSSEPASDESCRIFSWDVKIDEQRNKVTTGITGSHSNPFVHRLNFKDVFPERAIGENPQEPPYHGSVDLMLSALRACLRCVIFFNTLDSKKLISLVQGMEKVVYIAPKDRPPRLPITERPIERGRVPTSPRLEIFPERGFVPKPYAPENQEVRFLDQSAVQRPPQQSFGNLAPDNHEVRITREAPEACDYEHNARRDPDRIYPRARIETICVSSPGYFHIHARPSYQSDRMSDEGLGQLYDHTRQSYREDDQTPLWTRFLRQNVSLETLYRSKIEYLVDPNVGFGLLVLQYLNCGSNILVTGF